MMTNQYDLSLLVRMRGVNNSRCPMMNELKIESIGLNVELDTQRQRIARLEQALRNANGPLADARDTICGEFCGKEHHRLCACVGVDIDTINAVLEENNGR